MRAGVRAARRPFQTASVGPFIAPRIASARKTAASRLLPLRFGRQTVAGLMLPWQPFAVETRLEPVDTDHGLIWMGESRIVPPGWRRRAGGIEEACVLGVRDGRPGNRERVDPYAMPWALARMSFVPPHPERPRGDVHELHGVEYRKLRRRGERQVPLGRSVVTVRRWSYRRRW